MIMACDLALFGRRGGCGQHAQMRTWGWHSARAQAARNVQNAELAKSANEDQPEVLNRHLRGTLTARPPALQIQDLRMYAAIRNTPPCALPIIELGKPLNWTTPIAQRTEICKAAPRDTANLLAPPRNMRRTGHKMRLETLGCNNSRKARKEFLGCQWRMRCNATRSPAAAETASESTTFVNPVSFRRRAP